MSLLVLLVFRPSDFSKEHLRGYATLVFQAFFKDEIAKKLSMKDQYKGVSHKPTPLDLDGIDYQTNFDIYSKEAM